MFPNNTSYGDTSQFTPIGKAPFSPPSPGVNYRELTVTYFKEERMSNSMNTYTIEFDFNMNILGGNNNSHFFF